MDAKFQPNGRTGEPGHPLGVGKNDDKVLNAMRIECPSCKYSAEVNKEKVPQRGGNTRCPRCSTVFFVAPVELEPPEISFARTCCPKCGVEQESTDTCGNCGFIYAKHRTATRPVTQNAPADDGQRMGQDIHRASKPAGPFDKLQGVLLACGVLATAYSLKRGIILMTVEEKFREKYHLIPSKIGLLNRTYSSVLPSIAIAETIFLVLVVYSFRKRKFLSPHGTAGDFGIIHRNEISNAIGKIALFLMAFAVIAGIATTLEHDEGAMAIFLCIFIGLLLLVPLLISYLFKKISNDFVIWPLTAVAIAVEVASFTTLKPIVAFTHRTPLWLHDLQGRFWAGTPLILLVFLSIELCWTFREFRLKKAK